MRKSILLLFLLLLLFAVQVNAATYTIGSDVADDYTSWANFHAAVATPAAGDIISFRKGDTFRETVTVAASGSSGSPITYTAHGTGATPIISGGTLVSTWSQYLATAIYSAACNWTAYIVVEEGATILTNVAWDTDIATTAAAMSAGTWSLDTTNDLLYVWATDEADPDTHTIKPDVGTRYNTLNADAKSYITISNIRVTLDNSYTQGDANADSHAIRITGDCSNIIVSGCTINYCYNAGIKIGLKGQSTPRDTLSDIKIYDNTIHDVGVRGTDTWGISVTNSSNVDVYNNTVYNISAREGIGLNTGVTNARVYDNTVYDCGAACIYINAGFVDSDTISVYRNLVYHTGGTPTAGNGIVLGSEQATGTLSDIDVYYNVIYNIYTISLGIYNPHTNNYDNINFYNNTVSGHNSVLAIGSSADPNFEVTNLTVKNNIVYKNSGERTVYFGLEGSSSWTFDNNCYFSDTQQIVKDARGVVATYTFAQFAAYQAATGFDLASIAADPLFVDAANNNFHLQGNSPCLGIGRYDEEFPIGRSRYNRFGNFLKRRNK